MSGGLSRRIAQAESSRRLPIPALSSISLSRDSPCSSWAVSARVAWLKKL